MRDTELYAQILGVSRPWHVHGVELNLDGGDVEVFRRARREGRAAVTGVRGGVEPVRQAGALVAAFGHVPVPDDPGGGGAAGGVPGARGQDGPGALG